MNLILLSSGPVLHAVVVGHLGAAHNGVGPQENRNPGFDGIVPAGVLLPPRQGAASLAASPAAAKNTKVARHAGEGDSGANGLLSVRMALWT